MVNLNKRRAWILLGSIIITFVALRTFLHIFPHTNLNVASYNIHHLYTGLLLIVLGGIPLMIFNGNNLLVDFASILAGIGLSMALDQWIYLIVTDGSDLAYLLPVSFWGGLFMISCAAIYIAILMIFIKQEKHH